MADFPVWSLVHAMIFIVYISIIVLILSRNSKQAISWITAGLYACFALWSYGKIFIHNPGTPQNLAYLFDKIDAIGWCTFPALTLWFGLALRKHEILKNRAFYVLLAAASFFLIYLHWTGRLMTLPEKGNYGWHSEWVDASLWPYFYYAYYIGSVIYNIITISIFAVKSPSKITKKQLYIFNLSTGVALVIATYFEVLMNRLHLPGWDTPLSDIANVYIGIWAIGTFYAIIRHNLFTLTPATAAENIIAHMSEALFLLDDDLNIVYANDFACFMLNYDDKKIRGMHFSLLLQERHELNTILKYALKHGSLNAHETNLLHISGEPVPVLFSMNTLTEDRQVMGFSCIATDITERKMAEMQLSYERDRARTYIDTAEIMFLVLDRDHRVSLINRKGCEMLGAPEKDILGSDWIENFIPERFRKDMLSVFEKVVEIKGGTGEIDNYILTRSGKERLIRWSNAVLKSDTGEFAGILSAGIDITEQKMAEQELHESYEKLKELDIMKTNFTSMVSHELRTPLTSIKGFLSFLLGGIGGPLTPEQKKYLEIIRNNSDRLLALTNDILDLSKMDAGSFAVNKKSCSIIDLISAVLRDMQSIADRKNVKIDTLLSPQFPLVSADPVRLSQVVMNLVNNAIKFSPEGSPITVTVSNTLPEKIKFPAHAGRPHISGDCILVSVADKGMGIKRGHMPRIFTRYFQAEDVDTRHSQGTGLGLNIAKNIIDAHGGFIWADSEGENKGAVFSFLIPVL